MCYIFIGKIKVYQQLAPFLHIDMAQVFKSFLVWDNNLPILYCQYHGCWVNWMETGCPVQVLFWFGITHQVLAGIQSAKHWLDSDQGTRLCSKLVVVGRRKLRKNNSQFHFNGLRFTKRLLANLFLRAMKLLCWLMPQNFSCCSW